MCKMGFLLIFCLLALKIGHINCGQCEPFAADAYLPFDIRDGSTVIGHSLNGTLRAGATLTTNDQLSMGKAVSLNENSVLISTVSGHECFFDPMVRCNEGFTLSLLMSTNAGLTGSQVYISSGAEAANSWGFSLIFNVNEIAAHLKGVFGSTLLKDAQASDTSYVYSSAEPSAFMHVVIVWNATSETLTLYRDGALKAQAGTTSQNTYIERRYRDFVLGESNRGTSSGTGSGRIDELLYFYHSMTAEQVEAIYNYNYNGSLHCWTTCVGVADGRYQSCSGCNMFLDCVSEEALLHVCPIGYLWDSSASECSTNSNVTCSSNLLTAVQTEPCIPNECNNYVCLNGATCLYLENGFNCTCAPGFEGGYCEIDIDECESSPCIEGQCGDQVNGHFCNCTSGYYGVLCEELDGCFEAPCANNATCNDFVNGTEDTSFNCTCLPGYTGFLCDIEIDECESSPCVNNATCVDEVNGYTCQCPAGYLDTHCGSYDECYFNPCENGGNCTENSYLELDDFTCTCAAGFSDVTCRAEDECVTHAVDCENGGTCVDGEGRYNCTCAPGYEGEHCETDIDECALNPCVYGTCTDLVNMYSCSCNPGYQGVNCDDYNFCYDEPCDHGNCTDLADTLNLTYNCQCEYGFSDQNCSTENECLTRHVVCLNEGVCQDLEGDYTCVNCTEGYVGQDCEIDFNECESSPCQHGDNCSHHVNFFSCVCEPDYYGDLCEEFNACYAEPCENSGICADLTDGYSCDCTSTGGFYGENCTLEDECITQSIMCENGGTCADTPDSPWQCNCADGFSGLHCEHLDYCFLWEPCLNGATCSPDVDSYSCACAVGYSDFSCSFAEQCVLQNIVCQNGATCVNLPDDWQCECPATHFGRYCDTSNPCYEEPCYSVGTVSCVPETSTEYTCNCQQGFNDTLCDFGPCNSTESPPCNWNSTRSCTHFADASVDCECTTVYSGPSCDLLRALTDVAGSFRINNEEFTANLLDATSAAYVALKGAVEAGLSDVCECPAEVTGFRNGSVIVEFTLQVVVNLNVTALAQMLRDAAEAGQLLDSPYAIDLESITISVDSTGSTGGLTAFESITKSEESLQAVFFILLVLFILAVIVILLLLLYGVNKQRTASAQRKVVPDDEDALVDGGSVGEPDDDHERRSKKKERPTTAKSRQSTAWVDHSGNGKNGDDDSAENDESNPWEEVSFKPTVKGASATFDEPHFPWEKKNVYFGGGPVEEADDPYSSSTV